MARWSEFAFGDGVAWGHYLPPSVDVRRAWFVPAIRDVETNARVPASGPIISGGNVSQEHGQTPHARASVECINPANAYSATFTKGQIIRLETDLSYSGGVTYTADLGRFAIRKVTPNRDVDRPRSLTLDCVSEIEDILRMKVGGNLPVLAATVARRFGLMASDNTTASLPGVAAYLLTLGGITAVRTQGPVVNEQAYVTLSGTDYIGPFNVAPRRGAFAILTDILDLLGAYAYIDTDGTGVIAALPRNVYDLNAAPPVRRWAYSGTDASAMSIRPGDSTLIEQAQLTNQTSAGTDRVVYVVPADQGVPILAADLDEDASARTYNKAAFPVASGDVAQGQARLGQQLAYGQALAAAPINFRTVRDPSLRAGDSVRTDFATDGVVGPILLRRLSHTFSGRRLESVSEIPAEPTTTVTSLIDTTSYSYAHKAIQCGIGHSGVSRWLRQNSAAVHSVDAYATLFVTSSFTLEGFFRFVSWPKDSGGNNIALAPLVSPSCDLVLSGGTGATMTATATIYTTGGATALTGFNVTNNGDTWIHFRMVHNTAADSFRVWLDGILQASDTGVTDAPAAQYRNVRILSRLGSDVQVATSGVGRVAFNYVRYRADAVITDGSNFTVPSSPFTDTASPCLLNWPCRDVQPYDGVVADCLYSTAGNVYGRRDKVRSGQEAPGFIFDSPPYNAGASPPFA